MIGGHDAAASELGGGNFGSSDLQSALGPVAFIEAINASDDEDANRLPPSPPQPRSVRR